MKKDTKEEVKAAAKADLRTFINLIHPRRVLGGVHEEVCRWWQRPDRKPYSLLLLPRDHQKSALLAYRIAHRITIDPAVRILLLSSTSNLAVKQLGFIKSILTSDVYRRYWPEMINPEESKREKWTETEFSVDHPLRKENYVRDPTVFTAGLTTTVTGLHCDVAALDDPVVYENAYTSEGREKVKQQYSLLASIESTGAEEWVVGTRYFPLDLYNDMQEMRITEYDDEGVLVRDEELYDVFERPVETRGDGTGEFLWPRQQAFGKTYGFDARILAEKKAKYLDQVQFRAQYYNDPNDSSTALIQRDVFQYYDRKHLEVLDGKWHYKLKRLNVFAAVDFAYSLARRADYTAITVLGVDKDRNYYILDIDRFKTDKPHEYFEHILRLHQKWDFRTLRAEVTAAQKALVESLKHDHIRPHGLALSIDEFRPSRHEGTKEERIMAILQPRYSNRQMWHYIGGHCQTLEEELVMAKPAHDDIKDALAACVDVAKAPGSGMFNRLNNLVRNRELSHARFGGIS